MTDTKIIVGLGSCGIAAGAQSVHEYLLEANKDADIEVGITSCVGVCFAEPIVGLITRNQLMQETDSLFGHPDVEYESPSRSIEPRPEGDSREGFDTVILAADRRTLILDLRVSPRRIDQFRVLVEAR